MDEGTTDLRRDRFAAGCLAAASLLVVPLLARDPLVRVTDEAIKASGLGLLTSGAAATGAGILLLAALGLLGSGGLRDRLGRSSTRARGAVLAYRGALVLLGLGALVSGFIVPELARFYGGAAEADMKIFFGLLWLCRAVGVAVVKLALLAGWAAVVVLALALRGRGRPADMAAIGGAVVALGIPAAVGAGLLHLDAPGRIAMLAAESAFVLWVAVLLGTGRLEARAEAGVAAAPARA